MLLESIRRTYFVVRLCVLCLPFFLSNYYEAM